MATIIPTICDKCGAELGVPTKADHDEVVVPVSGFKVDAKCECGGRFSAPPGRYRRDKPSGKLIRIGEPRTPSIHKPPSDHRRH